MENLRKDVDGGRVLSLDALRGFDMFWIIGGGTIFESLVEVWKHPVTETIRVQLEHVKWEGFRFEDLIFPTFLFLVGAVLPFSLSRRVERGESPARIHLHILRRAAVLGIGADAENSVLHPPGHPSLPPSALQEITWHALPPARPCAAPLVRRVGDEEKVWPLEKYSEIFRKVSEMFQVEIYF